MVYTCFHAILTKSQPYPVSLIIQKNQAQSICVVLEAVYDWFSIVGIAE